LVPSDGEATSIAIGATSVVLPALTETKTSSLALAASPIGVDFAWLLGEAAVPEEPVICSEMLNEPVLVNVPAEIVVVLPRAVAPATWKAC